MSFLIQQSWNGLALGSVFALYALGFSLVLANLNVFHVAHAAIFTWGAVFAWQFIQEWHWPVPLAFVAAIVLAGVLNVAAYFGLIHHLERRKNKQLAAFISSVGGLAILIELADIRLGRSPASLPHDVFPIRRWDLGIVQMSSIQLLTIGVAVAVFVFLKWLMDATQLGREIKVVAFDREVAELLGVNATRINTFVFFLSGSLAGLGAILVAILFSVVDAQLGPSYMVLAITVVVIGGFGSVTGAFVGAILVGTLSTYTTGYISSSYREVVIFLALLAFLVVRPKGLFSVPNATARV